MSSGAGKDVREKMQKRQKKKIIRARKKKKKDQNVQVSKLARARVSQNLLPNSARYPESDSWF